MNVYDISQRTSSFDGRKTSEKGRLYAIHHKDNFEFFWDAPR